MIKLCAADIVIIPEYYKGTVKIGKEEWECLGYSRTGNTVRFANMRHTIYVDPNTIVLVNETNTEYKIGEEK